MSNSRMPNPHDYPTREAYEQALLNLPKELLVKSLVNHVVDHLYDNDACCCWYCTEGRLNAVLAAEAVARWERQCAAKRQNAPVKHHKGSQGPLF